MTDQLITVEVGESIHHANEQMRCTECDVEWPCFTFTQARKDAPHKMVVLLRAKSKWRPKPDRRAYQAAWARQKRQMRSC